VGNGSTHSVSVATHNNRMTVAFARRIYETEVERVFFSLISELGIPVEVQSNLIEQYA
jgi:hypothetical protein